MARAGKASGGKAPVEPAAADDGKAAVQDGTLSGEAMARLLGDISVRRLQQMANEGIVPKAARGRYPLVPVVQAYCKHLRAMAAGRGDDQLTEQRARLAKEQADKAARDNALAAGEVIPKADVVAGEQAMVARCRARLLAVPSKAAPLVAHETSPGKCKEILTDLQHEALEELSHTRGVPVPADADRSGDGRGGDRGDDGMGAAAAPDSERVGRPKPRAKRGVKRGAGKVVDRKG